ncbi:MAG TPA: hypothetical protein VJA16_17070 [Thermoanaerobaculia bacterium]
MGEVRAGFKRCDAQRKPFELKLVAGHLIGRERIREGRSARGSSGEYDRRRAHEPRNDSHRSLLLSPYSDPVTVRKAVEGLQREWKHRFTERLSKD